MSEALRGLSRLNTPMSKKFYLIRGPRIVNQLDEAAFSELEQNTLTFIPTTTKRQHAVTPVQITAVELIPAPQSGTLEARGEAQSGTNKYQPIILFSDVEYQDEDTGENITFTAVDNNEYHVAPISLHQNNVKVRCTCMDFRWRFAMANQQNDVLHGPGPELYTKKTDRPPNNPRNVPGVCKHLLRFVNELKNSRVVVV